MLFWWTNLCRIFLGKLWKFLLTAERIMYFFLVFFKAEKDRRGLVISFHQLSGLVPLFLPDQLINCPNIILFLVNFIQNLRSLLLKSIKSIRFLLILFLELINVIFVWFWRYKLLFIHSLNEFVHFLMFRFKALLFHSKNVGNLDIGKLWWFHHVRITVVVLRAWRSLVRTWIDLSTFDYGIFMQINGQVFLFLLIWFLDPHFAHHFIWLFCKGFQLFNFRKFNSLFLLTMIGIRILNMIVWLLVFMVTQVIVNHVVFLEIFNRIAIISPSLENRICVGLYLLVCVVRLLAIIKFVDANVLSVKIDVYIINQIIAYLLFLIFFLLEIDLCIFLLSLCFSLEIFQKLHVLLVTCVQNFFLILFFTLNWIRDLKMWSF